MRQLIRVQVPAWAPLLLIRRLDAFGVAGLPAGTAFPMVGPADPVASTPTVSSS